MGMRKSQHAYKSPDELRVASADSDAQQLAKLMAGLVPAKVNRGISGKGGVLRPWARVCGRVVYGQPVWVRPRSHAGPCRGIRRRRGSLRSGRPARRATRAASSSDPPGPSDPALLGPRFTFETFEYVTPGLTASERLERFYSDEVPEWARQQAWQMLAADVEAKRGQA
jgi:hypothetical protein